MPFSRTSSGMIPRIASRTKGRSNAESKASSGGSWRRTGSGRNRRAAHAGHIDTRGTVSNVVDAHFPMNIPDQMVGQVLPPPGAELRRFQAHDILRFRELLALNLAATTPAPPSFILFGFARRDEEGAGAAPFSPQCLKRRRLSRASSGAQASDPQSPRRQAGDRVDVIGNDPRRAAEYVVAPLAVSKTTPTPSSRAAWTMADVDHGPTAGQWQAPSPHVIKMQPNASCGAIWKASARRRGPRRLEPSNPRRSPLPGKVTE